MRRQRIPGHVIRRVLGRHAVCVFGLALCAIGCVLAVVGPVVVGNDWAAQDLRHVLLPPGLAHPCGTDAFGRDILARLVVGLRLAIVEILAGVGLAAGVGVPLGFLAGLAPGRVGALLDRVLMAVGDTIFAIPGLVLALLIVSLLGPGLWHALIAIGLSAAPVYMRLARGLAASLRHAPFIEALRTLGASPLRIVFLHVLPNVASSLLVQMTLGAGSVVLAAAALSFLGLGAQPPMPEWGAMMSDGRNTLGAAFWPCLFPGIAIALAVVALNCAGDGLRPFVASCRAIVADNAAVRELRQEPSTDGDAR